MFCFLSGEYQIYTVLFLIDLEFSFQSFRVLCASATIGNYSFVSYLFNNTSLDYF